MMSNASKASLREARDLPLTTAALREIGLFGALSDEVLEHLAGSLEDDARVPWRHRFSRG